MNGKGKKPQAENGKTNRMKNISNEELIKQLNRIRQNLLQTASTFDSTHKPKQSTIGHLVLIESTSNTPTDPNELTSKIAAAQ